MYAEYFAGDQSNESEFAITFDSPEDSEVYSSYIAFAWAEWDEKEQSWKVQVRPETPQQEEPKARSKASHPRVQLRKRVLQRPRYKAALWCKGRRK